MTEEEKIFDVAPGEKYVDDRSRMTIFFQVLGRKFWKLISMNLIFLIFNIPSIIISFLLSGYVINVFSPFIENADEMAAVLFVYSFPLLMFLMVIPAITVGPAQAGLTYLLRCFSYELPTFYWSDFKDKMKENLKQGIAVSLINLVAIVLLIIDFYLYGQMTDNGSNFMLSAANGLLIVVFLLFVMMSMYIYPMMVSYELNLKNLYKNAFLFSIGRFLPNLGVLIICFLLVIGPMAVVMFSGNAIVLVIVYIYYLILGFSLPGLVLNFFINPAIDKYLRPAPAQGNKE
ncbi:MAG: DUF624 domain-containing protein [Clostridiaceae bacterium]|jgi:uncharacterized membrane protein YesL|nr:DUF624 domain-containing protein [Clostridiaceae bacterium]